MAAAPVIETERSRGARHLSLARRPGDAGDLPLLADRRRGPRLSRHSIRRRSKTTLTEEAAAVRPAGRAFQHKSGAASGPGAREHRHDAFAHFIGSRFRICPLTHASAHVPRSGHAVFPFPVATWRRRLDELTFDDTDVEDQHEALYAHGCKLDSGLGQEDPTPRGLPLMAAGMSMSPASTALQGCQRPRQRERSPKSAVTPSRLRSSSREGSMASPSSACASVCTVGCLPPV